jgi:hypothetical protein
MATRKPAKRTSPGPKAAAKRATTTPLALGSWRPGFDEHAPRNAIAGFLVRWCVAGIG